MGERAGSGRNDNRREPSRATLRRWKGWRTEWVGARSLFWLVVGDALDLVAALLQRFAAKANRRWIRRRHEYVLRCKERA